MVELGNRPKRKVDDLCRPCLALIAFRISKLTYLRQVRETALRKGAAMFISTSNQLSGRIVSIYEGAVNGTVGVELKSGEVVTASITMDSICKMNLQVGDEITVCIKASDVILAKD